MMAVQSRDEVRTWLAARTQEIDEQRARHAQRIARHESESREIQNVMDSIVRTCNEPLVQLQRELAA